MQYMNKPDTVIDLMDSTCDYKMECERLVSIVEQLAHERDAIETELKRTQLKYEMCKLKLKMIKEIMK